MTHTALCALICLPFVVTGHDVFTLFCLCLLVDVLGSFVKQS